MITIKKDNHTLFNSSDWRVIDNHVGDIEVDNNISNASGLPGGTFYGAEYGARVISFVIEKYISGLGDFNSGRRQLYKAFNQGECQLFLEPDKFINVVKNSETEVSRLGFTKMRCAVEFVTTRLPYFESASYDTQTFSNIADVHYDNHSDIDLDNRYTDTEFILSLNSSADFYQITVNGTSWRYKESLSSGDELQLKQATTFKNGEDVLEDTTLNVLTLKPSNNVLEMLGSMQYELTIRTKIYSY